MYCFYNNFCGKHWAVIGPEMSGPHGSPDYWGTTVLCFGTTVCHQRGPVQSNACLIQWLLFWERDSDTQSLRLTN
jgi:hypothetical protein